MCICDTQMHKWQLKFPAISDRIIVFWWLKPCCSLWEHVSSPYSFFSNFFSDSDVYHGSSENASTQHTPSWWHWADPLEWFNGLNNKGSNSVQGCVTTWDLARDIQVCAGGKKGLVWLNQYICNNVCDLLVASKTKKQMYVLYNICTNVRKKIEAFKTADRTTTN